MKISCGKNRYLEKVNFGREMFCNMNLPPMHILAEMFVPELAMELVKKNKFFRKVSKERPSWVKNFVSVDLSASLFNFRKDYFV